jgi:hypothetical protein
MDTVRYPESVCNCRHAEAVVACKVKLVEPVPLLENPLTIPDHSVSESTDMVKVAEFGPEKPSNVEKLVLQ